MADSISLSSDFKVYEKEFNMGLYEALYLNSMIFNQGSNNAILLIPDEHQGNYLKNAFFTQISSLITRQDITSTSAVDSKKLEQTEAVEVKLHRKIGPVQITRKALKMAGLDGLANMLSTEQGNMVLGRFIGDFILKDMASSAIIALNAAVAGQTSLVLDVTSETVKTASLENLIRTRGKWGDQMTELAAWLIHSKNIIDLAVNALDYSLESVAGVAIANGALSKAAGGPFVMSDNTNLVNSGTPNSYNVLGLKAGAAIVRESELNEIWVNKITGQEQLIAEIQGEYAITIGIDGFAWDTTNGGVNPTDSTLGTSTNWDKVITDTTGIPIVKLKCN